MIRNIECAADTSIPIFREYLKVRAKGKFDESVDANGMSETDKKSVFVLTVEDGKFTGGVRVVIRPPGEEPNVPLLPYQQRVIFDPMQMRTPDVDLRRYLVAQIDGFTAIEGHSIGFAMETAEEVLKRSDGKIPDVYKRLGLNRSADLIIGTPVHGTYKSRFPYYYRFGEVHLISKKGHGPNNVRDFYVYPVSHHESHFGMTPEILSLSKELRGHVSTADLRGYSMNDRTRDMQQKIPLGIGTDLIAGIIWDFDGVIVDHMPPIVAAYSYGLAELAKEGIIIPDNLRNRDHKGHRVFLTELLQNKALADRVWDKIIEPYYLEHILELTEHIPGVDEVMEYCRDTRIAQIIVSNSKQSHIDAQVDKFAFGIKAYGGAMKPKPNKIARAVRDIRRINPTGRIILIGDSAKDIEAAQKYNELQTGDYIHPILFSAREVKREKTICPNQEFGFVMDHRDFLTRLRMHQDRYRSYRGTYELAKVPGPAVVGVSESGAARFPIQWRN